jgi:hypothetical protein
VLGKVVYDRDCPPPLKDPVENIWHVVCIGREVQVVIRKTWKGPTEAGDRLYLNMPPDDSGRSMREGEAHVVFATLGDLTKSAAWFGATDSCMLPEGAKSSDKGLGKRLDAWHEAHKS